MTGKQEKPDKIIYNIDEEIKERKERTKKAILFLQENSNLTLEEIKNHYNKTQELKKSLLYSSIIEYFEIMLGLTFETITYKELENIRLESTFLKKGDFLKAIKFYNRKRLRDENKRRKSLFTNIEPYLVSNYKYALRIMYREIEENKKYSKTTYYNTLKKIKELGYNEFKKDYIEYRNREKEKIRKLEEKYKEENKKWRDEDIKFWKDQGKTETFLEKI